MEFTPDHEQHNPELLALIPPQMRRVVEIGCSSGAMAREYKKLNPACHYFGVDLSPKYAQKAARYCDAVAALDIEQVDDLTLQTTLAADCWIFGDTLEHLRDPWRVLQRVRSVLPPQGCVVACIPNAQHWSVQLRLALGEFRYEDSGLLDRTHLRWFTRVTIVDMFQNAGFRIERALQRMFPEPDRERAMPAIRAMALAFGANPEVAMRDAAPIQYVVRAVCA
jgi:SAM-dependent methyltransferase